MAAVIADSDPASDGTGAGGLGSPQARWALVAVWMIGVAGTILAADLRHPEAVRPALYGSQLAGWLLLTERGDHPLGRAHAAATSSCAVLSGLLALVGMPTGVNWMFAYAVYIGGLLIVRGNGSAGGIGAGVLLACGLIQGWRTDASVAAVADMLVTPAMAAAFGVVWRTVQRSIAATERRHRTAAAKATLAARIADEAAERNRQDLRTIRDEVAPLLRQIITGLPLDESTHRELMVVEASVRDRLRSPLLQHPVLTKAVTERRREGVRVLILGEETRDGTTIGDDLATAISDLIAAVPDGSITIRIVPTRAFSGPVPTRPGSSDRRPAVTVLVERGDLIERIVVTDAGELLSRA